MFWADKIVDEIEKRYQSDIKAKKPLVIRDEKTASGRVHIGSLRSASLHGLVSEILTERGIANTFYFEINDFDLMDGMPVYLDEKKYRPFMGKLLYTVPSPCLEGMGEERENFAEYFGVEHENVIKEIGFNPKIYRGSELYFSGRMNDVIRDALTHADVVRKIYEEVSGSVHSADWLPLSVVCEKCGKVGTTRATSFDGDKVSYSCEPKMVEWAVGCGHEGEVSPFDGRAKLPWKVEWAAKFKIMNVKFEGAGKDHYTKGGARAVADRISKEVFNYDPPYGVPNEFFLVGGKKMSSSKGAGISAREIVDMIPGKILRLALFGKDINRQVNFDPEGDTIPLLYDQYDRIAEKYFSDVDDDEARLFSLIHYSCEREKLTRTFLPRFSQVVFLVQMLHMNLEEEVEKMKGESLTQEDKLELKERARYARLWLERYAGEEYKYQLREENVPEEAKTFSSEQKKALHLLLSYITEKKVLDGQELHTKLHEIKSETGISPKEFFTSIYISFLGKESGPKAGWFLSVLDRKFLIERLKEVSS